MFYGYAIGAKRMSERKKCMEYIRSLEFGKKKELICKSRTEYCIEWYTRKAVKYKRVFIALSIINIAIPQISSILILQTDCSLVSAIFSSVVSFSAALLALLNVKDRWTRYRKEAEYIKKEYTLYCLQASPYDGDNPHGTYMCVLEQHMAAEQSDWVKTQKEPGKEIVEE